MAVVNDGRYRCDIDEMMFVEQRLSFARMRLISDSDFSPSCYARTNVRPI
jgi:hypothetical protein